MYIPQKLKLWTMPQNYCGEVWPATYVFLSQNRDSDCLDRSNFQSGLAAIGGESDTVQVVRESHWACGWIEWIAIHESNATSLEIADKIAQNLDNYPVVNEDHLSTLEDQEAQEVWRNCYDDRERVKYIRDHRDEFEFSSLADLRQCVRGEFFNGYASELLG